MDTGLAEKVVVVTGATANIGRSIALAFAAEGARLVLVGRDAVKGAEVVSQARMAGASDTHFHACDVSNQNDVLAMVAAVIHRLGAIDVLVNNVGGNTGLFRLFADTNPDEWQADFDLNIKTMMLCIHSVLPHMSARESGRIINIGSTAGDVGDYMLGVYSAAKGAVHTFTRALAREVGEYNITVNCVAPYATFPEDPSHTSSGSRFKADGLFASDPNLARSELKHKLLRTGVLPRGSAKPAEIAGAVVYMASEQAAFVTGQIHFVDGGALL